MQYYLITEILPSITFLSSCEITPLSKRGIDDCSLGYLCRLIVGVMCLFLTVPRFGMWSVVFGFSFHLLVVYSKTCLKWQLKNRQNKGLNGKW